MCFCQSRIRPVATEHIPCLPSGAITWLNCCRSHSNNALIEREPEARSAREVFTRPDSSGWTTHGDPRVVRLAGETLYFLFQLNVKAMAASGADDLLNT